VDEPTAGQSIDSGTYGGETRLAALLSAVGDSLRLRILVLVGKEGRSVAEICRALGAAQPRISHHLAVLKKNGFLEAEVVGRKRIYRWTRGGPPSARLDLQHFLMRWLELKSDEEPSVAEERIEKAPAPPSAGGDLEDYLL